MPKIRPSVPAGLKAVEAKHAQQHDAQRAADAVHAPDVERIVPLQPVLQRHGEVADDAGAIPMMTAAIGET